MQRGEFRFVLLILGQLFIYIHFIYMNKLENTIAKKYLGIFKNTW